MRKNTYFKLIKIKRNICIFLKRNAFRNGIEIIAYCIMDNHVHILLYCSEIDSMSKMMSQCNTSFGKYYSKERQNVGHVFRDRFKSESIYTKEHLINCIKYIHNNPVKAQICKKPDEYYFSSYRNFSYADSVVKELTDLSDDEINSILENSYTITRFLDDDYSKDDIIIAFEEIKKEICYNENDDNKVGQMYLKLKEHCRINDTKIAELLNMKRTTLNTKLRKIGLK